uniref:Uncharacterized protein n=1 Tax=Rhizophora mucronata TaxID=61149 RepID=A0A2P2PBL3_RHIMU
MMTMITKVGWRRGKGPGGLQSCRGDTLDGDSTKYRCSTHGKYALQAGRIRTQLEGWEMLLRQTEQSKSASSSRWLFGFEDGCLCLSLGHLM